MEGAAGSHAGLPAAPTHASARGRPGPPWPTGRDVPASTAGRRHLQIGPSPLRCHFVECHLTVHENLEGTLSVTDGPHVLGRHTAEGLPLGQQAVAWWP